MRSFRAAIVAILLTAGFGLATAPAAEAVTQAALSCESGASKYMCSVFHDAVGTPTIRWRVNGQPVTFLNDQVWTGKRFCVAGQLYDVQVDVTDATGTASGFCAFVCNSGDWP
jgi:hypothetical protein